VRRSGEAVGASSYRLAVRAPSLPRSAACSRPLCRATPVLMRFRGEGRNVCASCAPPQSAAIPGFMRFLVGRKDLPFGRTETIRWLFGRKQEVRGVGAERHRGLCVGRVKPSARRVRGRRGGAPAAVDLRLSAPAVPRNPCAHAVSRGGGALCARLRAPSVGRDPCVHAASGGAQGSPFWAHKDDVLRALRPVHKSPPCGSVGSRRRPQDKSPSASRRASSPHVVMRPDDRVWAGTRSPRSAVDI
jgi:hypothetical protein